MSETGLARGSLSKWCKGYGIDLGFGGDKIVPHAIAVDLAVPYTKTGMDPVQLGGDARDLYWFKDGVLGWVYSSHLLEDFTDTTSVLAEWTRVLKKDGFLILYLPDEQAYRAYCQKNGQGRNPNHKNENFNAEWVKKCAESLGNLELVHCSEIVNGYSFEIVFKKK